jgi:GNAT superfamily N-acetyltransferase
MPAFLLTEVGPAETWRPHLVARTLWVADDDGPVAFLAGSIEDGRLHIDELDVQQDRQGQGLGRGLLNHAMDWARSHGLSALSLTTFRNIAWNAPFYARFGFREWDADRAPASIREKLAHEAERGLPDRCAMLMPL